MVIIRPVIEAIIKSCANADPMRLLYIVKIFEKVTATAATRVVVDRCDGTEGEDAMKGTLTVKFSQLQEFNKFMDLLIKGKNY